MPASTTLQLEVETPEANTLQWQLTDIQGRILEISEKESKQTRHEQQILVEELPAGIYLFQANVGDKTVYRKIIKE